MERRRSCSIISAELLQLEMTISPRMHRLFSADGRCLNVALDHGVFHAASLMPGLHSIARAIGTVVKAGPDAVQLAPGPARILQSIPGPSKPALVFRLDTTNVYESRHGGGGVYSVMADGAVEEAVQLDAAAVVLNLLSVPGETELHAKCIRHIGEARRRCEEFGMPLIVEPLVLQASTEGGYLSSKNADAIALLVRQAVELGADLIKADPCDPVERFFEVVEAACGKPVLVRGGQRMPLNELLEQTAKVLQTGPRGLVFGRNIVQHPNPEGMVKALMLLLHEGRSPEGVESIAGDEGPGMA